MSESSSTTTTAAMPTMDSTTTDQESATEGMGAEGLDLDLLESREEAPLPSVIAWVEIRHLVRDESFQVRKRLDMRTVGDYARCYRNRERMPPLEVARVGQALFLVDGWHRLAALQRLEEESASVNIVEVQDIEQARWLAAKANTRHGLPLKPKEVRQVFRVFVNTGQHLWPNGSLKTCEQITQGIGGRVNRSTVWRWFQEDYPEVAAQMSRSMNKVREDKGTWRRGHNLHPAVAAFGQLWEASRSVTEPEQRRKLAEHVAKLQRVLQEPPQPVPLTLPGDLDF